MWVCYWICKNYGLAIILFTVLTKVILFPINIWVQKNSIKMVKLQPEVNQIMARHVGNKDKAAEEQMALYKREHYRPMVGMIPMLIQIPIILGLISVVYNPLQHLLHMDPQIISAFVAEATQLTGMELGSTAQLKVIACFFVDFFFILPPHLSISALKSLTTLVPFSALGVAC